MRRKAKQLTALLLALVLVLGLGTTALAAEEEPKNRVFALSANSGYTVTLLDADGNAIVPASEDVNGDEVADTVYKNVEKLTLSFTGTLGEQYAVFMLNGNSSIPTDSNIRYIDQLPGTATVEFTVYPDDLTIPGVYKIYVADSNGSAAVASLTVAQPPYPKGDVDKSGTVTPYDASLILQYAADLIDLDEVQLNLANTDGAGGVTPYDASLILQFTADIIDEL